MILSELVSPTLCPKGREHRRASEHPENSSNQSWLCTQCVVQRRQSISHTYTCRHTHVHTCPHTPTPSADAQWIPTSQGQQQPDPFHLPTVSLYLTRRLCPRNQGTSPCHSTQTPQQTKRGNCRSMDLPKGDLPSLDPGGHLTLRHEILTEVVG